MNIDGVNRLPGTGSYKYGGGQSYKVMWEIQFSAGYDEAALIHNTDARLPKIGGYLGEESGSTSSDTNTFCMGFDVALKEGSLYNPTDTSVAKSGIATLTATFEQIKPQYAASPLDRIDIQWAGSDITQVPTKDQDGNPFLNSAGQPRSGVPAYPIRAGSVVITIRQEANPGDLVTESSYTTNASAIWGVAAGNGLIGKITAKKTQENGLQFWEVSFPISFRRDAWKLQMIDAGLVFLDDDGNPQTCTDALGNAKPTPVLLDGSGNELDPDGDPVVFPDGGDDVFEESEWSAFGLPNPFSY